MSAEHDRPDLPDSLGAWLALLEQRHGQRIELGLERVAAVRDRMAAESDAVLITVGGTNGKGSCCAMLESILLAAGYRVGCYTSPHLLRYNERVRVDGHEVDDGALVRAFAAVEVARGDTVLTYFEHGTLAAWQVFADAALDVVILEVGLGGRLDAVNVFEPDCALVTSIAMDHMDYLGDTREAIGFEKAGIFRAGRPAVCGDPQPPVTLVEHAAEIGAALWISGRDFGFGGDRQQWGYWRYAEPPAQGALVKRGGMAYPALRGANQLLNAAQAMDGKGEVRISAQVDEPARKAVLHVRDTGKGIEPQYLGRVFDPFFSLKPVGEGTGLGLSIAFGIVGKHQGTLEVQSQPGQGACFTVRLPLAGGLGAEASGADA